MYKAWPDEIRKWAEFSGLTYAILHADVKAYNLTADADIYLINPEGILWLFDPRNSHRPQFDVLCVDESTRFKDSQTRRFKLLKPFLPTFKRRWILTGTPSPNGAMDLFSQTYIMDLGRALGRFITHFRAQFFDQNPHVAYSWTLKPDGFVRITESIAPLVLQLSAEDNLKMPALSFINLQVTLPPDAMKIYREMEDDFIISLEENTIAAANAAVAGGKCRQIANGALYTDQEHNWFSVHDEKLDKLESFIEEMSGKPVIILYEFKHDVQRILDRIRGVEHLRSGLSGTKMDDIIDRFNAGKIPVLLGHPATMGHGLNLQGSCHTVLWFGVTWNLEHYDQAIARVYRQGQKSERVTVYHIVAKGTLDERVLETLQTKDRDQRKLLAAIADYRTKHL
jgi:hypothetical protein